MKIKYTIIFTIFLLFSCGSVKKKKETFESDKKTETSTNINSEKETDTRGENVVLRPADSTKPIIIYRDGKRDTLWNTIVEKRYYETKIKEIEKKQEDKKEDERVKTVVQEKEKDNTKLFLGIAGIISLLFLLIIIFVVWYFSKQIKTAIPKG